jgi:FkbM family methyltransferase
MNLIKRIIRKIGLISGMSYVGFYQKKWYKAGGDNKFRFNFGIDHSEIKVVFDLGAFDGEFTAKMLELNVANVYAFDTNPYQVKKINARFEKSKNVRIFDFGLGCEDFYGKVIGSGAGASIQRDGGGGLIVRQFANFVNTEKIGKIDILKINIEGAEYSLIRHLSEVDYLKNIDILQIQFHDFVDDALSQLLEMHRILSISHVLDFSFPFVWDQWRLKK